MTNKKAECIRTVANWGRMKNQYIFDQKAFDPEAFKEVMDEASPKLTALFDKIAELDAADKERDGKHYKHMIFSDVRQAQYGVKLLAAAFVAKGYKHLYKVKSVAGKKELAMVDQKELKMGKNFATLCSTTIYGKTMTVKFRKQIMEMYNARPENIHGENVRFILLDRGFKEGIDLFDVKYVHLFEPLISMSDEKQAIGRATRFCGQKGLPFVPKRGWDLHVYHYEVSLPEEYDVTRMLQLYLNYSGLDLRRVVFSSVLEKTTMMAAVDAPLTRNIHDPDRDQGSNDFKSLFDVKPHMPKPPSKEKPLDLFDRRTMMTTQWRSKGPLFSPKKEIKMKKEGGGKRPMAPRTKMTAAKLTEYIKERFGRYEWPAIKLENLCGTVGEGGGGEIVKFTPTQDFVRNYFNPSSVYKGLMLYHGVGVGKTCSAMAIASTSFERQGYTILWVTRHTLKADIWKNMFRQVCSLTMQERLKKGQMIPDDAVTKPKKHLPSEWMMPISYKQFSNLLEGKNEFYQMMVERNGKEDPLRKTLVIMDEAHKLFAPDLRASERPNVQTLQDRIHHSYDVSGKDSCKVLLMTATPFNTDPMEMMQLLNLLRPRDEALPVDFDAFQQKYLDEEGTGTFTEGGRLRYMNDIAGYVSYLNREKDARQFAIPKFHNVIVPMTRSEFPTARQRKVIADVMQRLEVLDEDLEQGKEALAAAKIRVKEDLAKELEKCAEAPRGTKVDCKKRVREQMKQFKEQLLEELSTKIEDAKYERKILMAEKKEAAKRLKAVKNTMDQESALETRCNVDMGVL